MNGCCPPVPPQCQPFDVPGSPGQNAFSFIIAPFAIPPDTATPIIITMGSTAWVVPHMYIIVGDQVDGSGTFIVQSVTSPTTVSALWVDAAGDSIAGTIFNPANNPVVSGTGGPGLGGANGVNAFTILTANSAIPADTNTPVTFVVGNSQWMVVGQTIIVGDAADGAGTFRVTGITDATHITALWLNAVGDAPPLQPLLTSNLATVSPTGVPGASKFRSVNTASSPTSGTGETTLMSVSVPANTMVNNGDSLEFESVVNLAGGSGNNTVKLYFGASNFATWGPIALNNQILIARGRIFRTGPATQIVNCQVLVGGGTVAQAVETFFSNTLAETLSGAVLFKCTGTASAGGFSQVSQYLRLSPI